MIRLFKTEWVSRLRHYALHGIRQGRGCMGTITGERCCLGVLGDILVENKVITRSLERSNSNVGEIAYDGNGGALSRKALIAIGLPTTFENLRAGEYCTIGNGSVNITLTQAIPLSNGQTLEVGRQVAMTELNDTYGLSFEEIADVIEREIPADDE